MLWLLIKGLQVYVSTDDNILYTVFNWEVTVGHREEYDAWENARTSDCKQHKKVIAVMPTFVGNLHTLT